MTEVDLMSLGSYTELPGGNIRWRYRAEMEEVKNDKVNLVKV